MRIAAVAVIPRLARRVKFGVSTDHLSLTLLPMISSIRVQGAVPHTAAPHRRRIDLVSERRNRLSELLEASTLMP
jgi:hypothetical protein